MKAKDVKAAIEAAGFTVLNVVKPGRWFEVEKGGEAAVILHQHDGAWHWFSKPHAATASDSDVTRCDQGGLGDAIGDDAGMRQYERLIRSAPDKLVTQYNGLYAAALDMAND